MGNEDNLLFQVDITNLNDLENSLNECVRRVLTEKGIGGFKGSTPRDLVVKIYK